MRSVVRVLSFAELEHAGFVPAGKSLARAEANAKAFQDAWDSLDSFILPSPIEAISGKGRIDAEGNGGECSGITSTGLNISYPAPPNSKQVLAFTLTPRLILTLNLKQT